MASKIKCLKFTGLKQGSHTWFYRKPCDADPVGRRTGHARKDQILPVSDFADPQYYVNAGMAEVIEVDDATDTTPIDQTVARMPPSKDSNRPTM